MTEQTAETSRSVGEIRRQPIVVHNELMIFDTGKFEQMQRVASAMAEMKLMPEHLRKSPADCLLVVEQAWRWQMSPTAVASKTYSVSGKLAYEGQLVAAVINSSGLLHERLSYVYEGAFADGAPDPKKVTRSVWVVGHIKGEKEPRKIELWWKDGYAASKGARDKWLSQADQQLAYAGARVWARRHVPELLLGVYSPEDLDDEALRIGADYARDVTPPRPTRESVRAEHVDADGVVTERTEEEEAAAVAEAERGNRALDRMAQGLPPEEDEVEKDAETGEAEVKEGGGEAETKADNATHGQAGGPAQAEDAKPKPAKREPKPKTEPKAEPSKEEPKPSGLSDAAKAAADAKQREQGQAAPTVTRIDLPDLGTPPNWNTWMAGTKLIIDRAAAADIPTIAKLAKERNPPDVVAGAVGRACTQRLATLKAQAGK